LYGIVSARGADLKGHIMNIVTDLVAKMQFITGDATLNGSLHALKTLAKLHLDDTGSPFSSPWFPLSRMFILLIFVSLSRGVAEGTDSSPTPRRQGPSTPLARFGVGAWLTFPLV